MNESITLAEDVCQHCGAHVGYGVEWLHLKCCGCCSEERDEPDVCIGSDRDDISAAF